MPGIPNAYVRFGANLLSGLGRTRSVLKNFKNIGPDIAKKDKYRKRHILSASGKREINLSKSEMKRMTNVVKLELNSHA